MVNLRVGTRVDVCFVPYLPLKRMDSSNILRHRCTYEITERTIAGRTVLMKFREDVELFDQILSQRLSLSLEQAQNKYGNSFHLIKSL